MEAVATVGDSYRSITKVSSAAADVAGKINEIAQHIDRKTAELMQLLHEFDSESMYEELGFESFTDWARSSMWPRGPKSAVHLLNVYRVMCVRGGVAVEDLTRSGWSKYRGVCLRAIREGVRTPKQAFRELKGLPFRKAQAYIKKARLDHKKEGTEPFIVSTDVEGGWIEITIHAKSEEEARRKHEAQINRFKLLENLDLGETFSIRRR